MNPELCEIYEKVHRRKLGIGIRNWTNKCKYCDKGFFQSQKSIKRHEMAHTGENHGGKYNHFEIEPISAIIVTKDFFNPKKVQKGP